MPTNNEVLNWFQTTKHKPVIVNDTEYECIKGKQTNSGFYKNGFRVGVLPGNKKNTEYLIIHIYTSARQQVDIEEKYTFLKKDGNYILKKWVGWNDFNLMKFDWEDSYMDMLRAIYNKYH
jgi:hypothetical protein